MLPRGKRDAADPLKDGKVLVLVSVSDSLGGVNNQTLELSVFGTDISSQLANMRARLAASRATDLPRDRILLSNLIVLEMEQMWKEGCDTNGCADAGRSGLDPPRGTCDPASLLCTCTNSLFGPDCTLTSSELEDYALLRNELYLDLVAFRDAETAPEIKEQIVRSISLLLREESVTLSRTEFDAQIAVIDADLLALRQQASSFVSQNLVNQGLTHVQRGLQQQSGLVGKIMDQLDKLYVNSVKKLGGGARRRLQSGSEAVAQMQVLAEKMKAVQETTLLTRLPNSEAVSFEGGEMRVMALKATTGRALELFNSQTTDLNKEIEVGPTPSTPSIYEVS